MKQLCIAITAILLTALTANAEYSSSYYSQMNGKKKEQLKAGAKACVQNHTRLQYYELPNQWQYTDVYVDLYQGQKRWWEMYSNKILLIRSGQTALSSFSQNRMQREHSIPKSWWKKNGDVEYTPAYSDLWNLYPSDGEANMAKSNYPYGECTTTTFTNGSCKVGSPKTGQGGGSGLVFEPADEYKGDFARTFFYMATVYDDLPWVYTYMFKQNSYPTLQPWAMNMLLDWARRDPVSQKEINRNEQVFFFQGNRNPYIDFPELAEYVWGMRTNEVFYVSEQGGQVTPPVTGDPEILDPILDEALDFGQVAVGQSVSAPLTIKAVNLTAPLSIRLIGGNKDQFSIGTNSIPAYQACSETGYNLNVIYNPTDVGMHQANLIIYDGGLDVENNIIIDLLAEAYPRPTLSTMRALPPTDLTPTSYTANWGPVNNEIDYIIVKRVRYPESGPESEDIIADSDALCIDITDRDESMAESYSVQSSRLGFVSEPSNVITIEPYNSVVDIEAAQPLTLGYMQGGFVVLLDSEHTNLRVYDMQGRMVRHISNVHGGECVTLPWGIYTVRTDQSIKPYKIAIR